MLSNWRSRKRTYRGSRHADAGQSSAPPTIMRLARCPLPPPTSCRSSELQIGFDTGRKTGGRCWIRRRQQTRNHPTLGPRRPACTTRCRIWSGCTGKASGSGFLSARCGLRDDSDCEGIRRARYLRSVTRLSAPGSRGKGCLPNEVSVRSGWTFISAEEGTY